jgi:hypothetical protein
MTLEAWVKPTVVTADWRDAVSRGSSYFLQATSPSSFGSAPVLGGSFDSATLVPGSTPLPTNTWSHLAGTYDGASLRLYVNGVEVRNVPQTGVLSASPGSLQIGGNTLYGQYFAGVIDETGTTSPSHQRDQADMSNRVGL